MSDIGPVILVILAASLIIFTLFVAPKYDRRRIREHIEANGGKVIEILRDWFGGDGGRYRRTYDVTYKTRHGERITATCVTSMTSGVRWVSDRPPGSGTETSKESQATEPIDCVQCGAKIPGGKRRCAHCGWSYEQGDS